MEMGLEGPSKHREEKRERRGKSKERWRVKGKRDGGETEWGRDRIAQLMMIVGCLTDKELRIIERFWTRNQLGFRRILCQSIDLTRVKGIYRRKRSRKE